MNMPRPKEPEPLTRGELRMLRNLLAKAEVLVNHVPPPPRAARGPERSKHAPPSTPELETFLGKDHTRRELLTATEEQLIELLDRRAIRARDAVIAAQRALWMDCGPIIEALRQPNKTDFASFMDVRQAERELEGVKRHILYQRWRIRQLRYARNKRAAKKAAEKERPKTRPKVSKKKRVQGADYFDDLLDDGKES